jgi:hypothetical protein
MQSNILGFDIPVVQVELQEKSARDCAALIHENFSFSLYLSKKGVILLRRAFRGACA